MANNKTQVYLLLGPEEGEKSIFIQNIIKNNTQQNGEKPEISRYYGFDTNLVDLVSDMRTGSLFSSCRVVILNGIEEVKKKSDVDLLAEYLSNPSDDVILFLTSSQVSGVSKSLENKIPKNQKKIFWELFDTQKRSWIQNFFSQRELTIDTKAIDYLLEIVENNTRDLRSVCQQLAFFFNSGKVIVVEDIEQFIYHSREENIFTLFEKVSFRDLSSAQEALLKIVQSGESEPIAVIIGLTWQLKKLLRYKLYQDKQFHSNEIFKKVNITSKKSQKIYSVGADNYSLKELTSIVTILNDYDILLRSNKKDIHLLLLQLLLYFVIVKGGLCKSYF
ncbi:MAG: DNA polymerase III subunit delta [Spirochaetales bacterium]|nr:DNA polymerase III subunit delta [Spirochaetales bacterium]